MLSDNLFAAFRSVTARVSSVVAALALISVPAMAADEEIALSASASASSDDFRINTVQKTGDAQRVAQKPSIKDPKFKALHASWGDTSSRAALLQNKREVSVSIPSIDPVKKMDISSYYGYRTDPFKGRRKNHKGLDVRGPVGTPIYATADGFVKTAKWFSSYGRFIELDHGNAIHTRYGHMSKLNVSANQYVKKGDVIGFMGSTGRSTGSHLHYEVRIAGQPVNPQSFMAYRSDGSPKLASKPNQAAQGSAQGGPAQ